jgi:glycine/D-amino acid oxidase-like deaminating enzyme
MPIWPGAPSPSPMRSRRWGIERDAGRNDARVSIKRVGKRDAHFFVMASFGGMRVGVLGGGLQGCCMALALAVRGIDVTLFDRNERLLSRAAVANEGKIHLGYMYANDASYSTARMMMQGALAFAPFFARHLGVPEDAMTVSRPAAYVVHRDSQRSPEQVSQYLTRVHALIQEASDGKRGAYFGLDFASEPRMWSAAEREAAFDPDVALAAFDTPEVAIDPVALASAVRERIAAEPRIEVRTSHEVVAVDDDGARLGVELGTVDGPATEHFDHVVNALWDGRFAINEKRGLRPRRPWLHRLKYGVSFRLPAGARLPPSATFVSGPFGEVVSYRDGLTYLTWYPVCLQGISSEVAPPEWPTYPAEPLRSQLLEGTLRAMAEFVPSLRAVDVEMLEDVTVKGGVIVAWGETDIYDPASELHRRFEIGVTSTGRFHSIDPGKLTMAPYFANLCADRITGDIRP